MGNIYSALKRGKNTMQDDDNDATFMSQKTYKQLINCIRMMGSNFIAMFSENMIYMKPTIWCLLRPAWVLLGSIYVTEYYKYS